MITKKCFSVRCSSRSGGKYKASSAPAQAIGERWKQQRRAKLKMEQTAGKETAKLELLLGKASSGAHGVVFSQNRTAQSTFSLKTMKFSQKPHITSGAPYQDLKKCTLRNPKRLNISLSWDSMFYISCVWYLGPLILSVQNRGGFDISHGFSVP